jgi:glutamate-ammonia-ligase adenylyltransferase
LLPPATADVLRSAGRLYHDLTQILRLCVSDRFVPAAAGDDLLRMLARAGDAPNFSALEARVRENQSDVREIFLDLLQQRS